MRRNNATRPLVGRGPSNSEVHAIDTSQPVGAPELHALCAPTVHAKSERRSGITPPSGSVPVAWLIKRSPTLSLSAVLAIVFGSWQAFLGGFLAGAAVAAIYLIEDDARRVGRARLLLVLLGVVLVVLAFARALFFLGA